jgi:hypothetical protein
MGARVGEALDISLLGMGGPIAALLASVFILIELREFCSTDRPT